MSEKQKEYLESSLLTFATGFAFALLPFLDSLTVESFQNGAVFAVLLAAFRGGLKALLEMWTKKKTAKKVAKKK